MLVVIYMFLDDIVYDEVTGRNITITGIATL